MNLFLARFGLAAAAALGSVSIATASNIYWDGTGTSWNNRTFWSTASNAATPDPIAKPAAGDISIFNISTVSAPQTVNLDAAQAAAGLVFNSSGAVAIQTGAGANALTVGASGISKNSGAGNDSISSLLNLGATQTWTNNSSQSLTVNGNISNGSNFLTVDGTGLSQITGAIGSGSGGVTKIGVGTLALSGNNAFTGGLSIQQGTVRIATINDSGTIGTLGNNTGVSLGATGQTGTLEFTGGSAASNMPFAVADGGMAAFQIDSAAATLTLTSNINGGFSAAIIKTGAGSLDVTGNIEGSVTINGGTFIQDGGSMLANIIINNGAAFAYNGGNRGGTITLGGATEMFVIGTNTLEITSPPAFSNSSSLTIGGGGTLRFRTDFNNQGVGTGAQVTISTGTALELAGSISTLSSGANRVSIRSSSIGNSSTAAGLLVSGGNQVVGGIDGTGSVEVDAGSSLMADHIVQSALAIDGAQGDPALVTIGASDASGKPLGQSADQTNRFILAGSLAPVAPFAPDGASTLLGVSPSDRSIDRSVAQGAVSTNDTSAVPEPSSLLLAVVAGAAAVSVRRPKRSR